MYEVEVSGWFAAAHQLRLLNGNMEPLHGHNWQVRVGFAGSALDGMSVLADFTVIKPALDAILARWHDRLLNELEDFAGINPSAEVVARRIAEKLAGVAGGVRLAYVAVEEAPGCVARYRPDPPALPMV